MCGARIEDNAVDSLAREEQVEVTFTVARSVIERIQGDPHYTAADLADEAIISTENFVTYGRSVYDIDGYYARNLVRNTAVLAARQVQLPKPIEVGQTRVDGRGQAIAIVGLLGEHAWVVEEGDDYPFTLNAGYIEQEYATVR